MFKMLKDIRRNKENADIHAKIHTLFVLFNA
jgi:hypothetical protein